MLPNDFAAAAGPTGKQLAHLGSGLADRQALCASSTLLLVKGEMQGPTILSAVLLELSNFFCFYLVFE